MELKFVVRFFVFFLLVFLLDRGFYFFRYPELNIFGLGASMKVDWVRDQIKSGNKYDLAVHGSSITQFGINADLIGKKLSVRGLNFGMGGEVHFYYSYRAIRCSVARFGVKQVVLQVSSTTFADPTNLLTQARVLPPDAAPDPEQDCAWQGDDPNRFKLTDNFIDIQKASGAFKYSGNVGRYLSDVRAGVFEPPFLRQISFKDPQLMDYGGLTISPDGQVLGITKMRTSVVDNVEMVWNPQESGATFLQGIAEFAKRNGVKLTVVQLPEFITMRIGNPTRYAQFENVMCQVADMLSLPFINMNTLEAFPTDDPRLFLDSGHLNIEGSKLLSERLAERLLKEDNSCRERRQTPVYTSLVRNLQFELKASRPQQERRILLDTIHAEGKFGEFDRVDFVDGNGLDKRLLTSSGVPTPQVDFDLGPIKTESGRRVREFNLRPSGQLVFPMKLNVPTSWGNLVKLRFRIRGLSEGPVTLSVSDLETRKKRDIQIENEDVELNLSEFF